MLSDRPFFLVQAMIFFLWIEMLNLLTRSAFSLYVFCGHLFSLKSSRISRIYKKVMAGPRRTLLYLLTDLRIFTTYVEWIQWINQAFIYVNRPRNTQANMSQFEPYQKPKTASICNIKNNNLGIHQHFKLIAFVIMFLNEKIV